MHMHMQTIKTQQLIAQYLQKGNSITVCATKRAKGVSYFALTSKASKHAGKANYGRGSKRLA